MTTMPPFLNIANVGNSKIPDSQMMQVFNFFSQDFRFSSILTMFLSHFLIRSGHQEDSNLIKLIVHCLQLNGKPIENITVYNKELNLSFFKLHLGKDSVTIIIFLVALSSEEHSNKSKKNTFPDDNYQSNDGF